jgi:ketosteroid isomerase-like protein
MIGALIARRIAREQFAARNRGDLDAFLSRFADDAIFVFPGEPPHGGTFRGLGQIRPWFEEFRTRHPRAKFEVLEVFVARPLALGRTNELAIRWRVSLGEAATDDNEGVTVVHVRQGKAVLAHDYIFDTSGPEFHAAMG